MSANTNITDDMYEILENVTNEDIKKFDISANYPNKKGEGFLGEMCFLNLKEKNGKKDFNFVMKKAFTNDFIRKEAPIRNVFLNEIFFYDKVWPCFRNFQQQYPLVKPFDKIPKYYASSSEDCIEKLILENLRFRNFEVFNKKKALDRDHIELIFKEYGKFHAISFAYKEINRKGFEELTKNLKDMWLEFSKTPQFPKSMKFMSEMGLKALCPEKDDKIIQKYNDYVEFAYEKYIESNKYEGNYSAILHGDCWSNNMMFKYNEARKPVDMKLIDFQCTKEGTPVFDLSYCLYSGASKEILDDLDLYLKLYYNTFSETISNFGLNPEKLYPFHALKSDWKRYCKFGFIMGVMIWRMKFTYDENIVDLTDFKDETTDMNETFMKTKFDEESFNKRVRDLIIHVYENDFM